MSQNEHFLGYDRKSVTSIDGKKSISNLKLSVEGDKYKSGKGKISGFLKGHFPLFYSFPLSG